MVAPDRGFTTMMRLNPQPCTNARFREKIRLSDPTWREELIAEVKEKGIVRVTFDPVAMAAVFNEISGEQWTEEVFQPVDEIIDATNAAVTLTHHANKLSIMGDIKVPAKAALRGHTSLPAWADSILFMRETNDGLVVEHAKMRGPRLGEFNLTIVHQDECVRVLCEDSDTKCKRTEELTRAIQEALVDGSELTQSELEREARRRVGGVTSTVVRRRVSQLTEEGVVEDLGGGGQGKPHRYRLAGVVK